MALAVTPADTDADGYPDSAEIALGTDPGTFCAIMRADVNGDGIVNIFDLLALAGIYGQAVPPAPARSEQGPPPFDGVINLFDLAQMASVYQQRVATCP